MKYHVIGLIKLPNWLVICSILGSFALALNAVTLLSEHVIYSVDFVIHYQWVTQFFNALVEGTVYPRWMPLANFGLGEPSFIIVHPAYYYIVSLLKALGLDLWTAMRWTATASTALVG